MLKDQDWSSIFTVDNVNEAWQNFKTIFTQVLDTVAPVKEVRLKQRSEPWIDSEIITLIKERDTYLYKFRTYNDTDFYKQFCCLRNKVQVAVKNAKADYISNKLEENKNSPKKVWKTLKNLGYSSKTKSYPNVVLNIENELCFDAKQIASHFNSFFTNVASRLVSKLPTPSNIFNTESQIFKQFSADRITTSKRCFFCAL